MKKKICVNFNFVRNYLKKPPFLLTQKQPINPPTKPKKNHQLQVITIKNNHAKLQTKILEIQNKGRTSNQILSPRHYNDQTQRFDHES